MSSTKKKRVSRSSGLDWKATAYMRRAMRWVLDHPAAGLFLDPGLRKTSITLASFIKLQELGIIRRMLVVAPVRVCYQVWPAEIIKWKQFEHLKAVILHDHNKVEAQLEDESVDIYIINPEGLEWLLGRPGPRGMIKPNTKRFKLLDCQMFVLDESSKFKNTQTKRFKLLRPFLSKFSQRLILTGSPRPNSWLDLFGQVYIMDLGRVFGPYITSYRRKYFDSSGFGGYTYVIKPGADKLIEKAVKPYVLRLEAEDYIDMPALVEPVIEIELPPKAREMYDAMEDDLFYLLENGKSLEAPTAAAARTKCAQIAGGAVYKNKDGMEVRGRYDFIEVHDLKLEALGEFLAERNGQPTLVFYYFQHELIRIRKYLAKHHGMKNIPCLSEVTPSKGKALEDAWNRNEIDVLLGQPASVGHGLNMQEGQANHCVFYSLPDDFDTYDQAIRRLRRSGNKNSHVFAHRIVARKTVDIAKGALLKRKGAGQKDFLDAMKSYRKPRSKR